MQCLSVDQLYKGQLTELPAILDSFYTTITNDYIRVEIRGGEEPWKWRVLPRVEVDTTRRSHLRPIWTLNVTNNSQFDGQAFWPVVWQFPAGWVLKRVRQAQETSPRKSRPGKQWQWYTHGLLVYWCRNRVVVKSQPCHCVCVWIHDEHSFIWYSKFILSPPQLFVHI